MFIIYRYNIFLYNDFTTSNLITSSIFIFFEDKVGLILSPLIKAYVSTFEGKNKAFLKSLSSTDNKNVPMNRIIDIRNTSGT